MGYATDAATLALQWAATELDDTVVLASTQTANMPSLRLLRRLGFSELGRFREFDAEQVLLIKDLAPVQNP
jgi:RimJ/RimL family protein N-acetyltransferase